MEEHVQHHVGRKRCDGRLCGGVGEAGSQEGGRRHPDAGLLLPVAARAQKLSPFLVDSDPKHIPIHLKPLIRVVDGSIIYKSYIGNLFQGFQQPRR
jgi:hypothetical protein